MEKQLRLTLPSSIFRYLILGTIWVRGWVAHVAGTQSIPGQGNRLDSWVAWGQHQECWEETRKAAAFGHPLNPQPDPVKGNGTAPSLRKADLTPGCRAGTLSSQTRLCLRSWGGWGHSTHQCWEASCNRSPLPAVKGTQMAGTNSPAAAHS